MQGRCCAVLFLSGSVDFLALSLSLGKDARLVWQHGTATKDSYGSARRMFSLRNCLVCSICAQKKEGSRSLFFFILCFFVVFSFRHRRRTLKRFLRGAFQIPHSRNYTPQALPPVYSHLQGGYHHHQLQQIFTNNSFDDEQAPGGCPGCVRAGGVHRRCAGLQLPGAELPHLHPRQRVSVQCVHGELHPDRWPVCAADVLRCDELQRVCERQPQPLRHVRQGLRRHHLRPVPVEASQRRFCPGCCLVDRRRCCPCCRRVRAAIQRSWPRFPSLPPFPNYPPFLDFFSGCFA
jgi:hypothetical protein